MRRVRLVSLALALLAAGTVWWIWSADPATTAAPPYRTAQVDRGTIVAQVRATGTLNPVTTVLVGSQLSGQVVEILADFNSPVKAGQVVARLNSDQIRARREGAAADLAQSEADLAVRSGQLAKAEATRARAEAAVLDQEAQRRRGEALLEDARRTLERQSELTARAVGSQTTLDTARTQYAVQTAAIASTDAQIAAAKAEMIGLDADIAVARAQIRAAEALAGQRRARLREIDIDLERTEIRSPVDGVVVQRQVDLGQTVAASLSAPTLFTIAQDLRQIDIHANIDEADVGRLAEGQTAAFTVNAHPGRTFEGRLRMVRLAAQTVQNVVTYTAIVRVENRDLALLPGMTANLQITTRERVDVLRVPNAALRFRAVGPSGQPLPAEPGAAPEAGAGRGRPGQALTAFRERLSSEIQPTAEQEAAIQRIFAEAREAAPARDPGLSPQERRDSFRRAGAEVTAKIAAVLDPVRRAKFDGLVADLRENRAGSGSPAMPGRVYVRGAGGEPVAVALRVGVSDGAYTEVISGDLASGAEVIIGGGPRPAAAAAPAQGSRPRPPRMF